MASVDDGLKGGNMIDKLRNFISKISTLLGWVSCAFVVIVAVFIVVSVFMRYVLKNPFIGSTEIVECMMAVMVFSCLAYTQSTKGHINIIMILRILPVRAAMVINALCMLAITVFSGYATYCLFLQAQYAGKKHLISALVHIPYSPFYYIATICMIVFTLVLLADTIIAFAAIGKNKYQEEIKGSWN